jgi:hypothetical protein
MQVAVIIPYRDRGTDPLRAANLVRVLQHWGDFGAPIVIASDGRTGTEQFNRSKAYNKAAHLTDTRVYAESDMLIDFTQINQAIELAQEPGLVVPFTEYRYLSEQDSQLVRDGAEPATFTPQKVINKSTRSWLRTGPINILTRETLQAVGQWDETFEGSQWDDRAMNHAFEVCTQPTRFIDGPAWHLYHLPAHNGLHLTKADRQATNHNRARYYQYLQATTPQQIHALTKGTA